MSKFPPMERTGVPGVFKRGGRFVVVWRADGRQCKRFFPTLVEAIAHKEETIAAKGDARRQLLEKARHARVRARADIADAYGFIRQAAQALDRAEVPTRAKWDALDALIAAEDVVARLVRETT